MPVWPFISGIAVCLLLWGIRNGAWELPALAVVGYIGMRAIVHTVAQPYVEVTGCAWWLVICFCLASFGGYLPALLYAASALTYPVMLLFGFRMEYMGLSPIIAEVFALLALLGIGGDIYGKSRDADTTWDSGGSSDRSLANQNHLAQGEAGVALAAQED